MKYTITWNGFNDIRSEQHRFAMADEEGNEVTGPCAKALSQSAWANGADEVDHRYDLNLDDCDEHTLRRVKV